MLYWLLITCWVALMSVCLLAIAGLALLLWDDISAERKYRSRRDL